MKKLNLYVWEEFAPDWTSGLAFAIAATEAKAREQVIAKVGYNASSWGAVTVIPLAQAIKDGVAFAVSGGS